MTIGSDQLDAWGRTIIECDELFREVQLLIHINPEAYTVDSDALAVVGAANSDGREDGDLLHPIVFARRWAWHLAAENKGIPPITNAWVPLIRYISAHLQYLGRDDREWFADDLRRVRGLLGALVNETGLSQGEAEALSALNAYQARKALRSWALTSDRMMTRKELSAAFPTLGKAEWTRLRVRKHRSDEDIPAYHYPVKWAAEIAPDDGGGIYEVPATPYRDVLSHQGALVSLDEMRDAELRADDMGEEDEYWM